MKDIMAMHAEWMKDPEYRKAYERQAPEFEIARALIELRSKKKLTQGELAKRIASSQSQVARLESGKTMPNADTLYRIAKATDTRLQISFVSPPVKPRAVAARGRRVSKVS